MSGSDFGDVSFGGTIKTGGTDIAYNENGTYKLESGSSGSIDSTVDPASDDDYTEGTSGSSATKGYTATIKPDKVEFPS